MNFGFHTFVQIRDMVYAKTGIFVPDNKIYSLKRRMEKRVEALGLPSPKEYIEYLKYADASGREFANLINEVTVNETYFFRNFPQLQVFAEHCLPDVVERKKQKKQRTVSILSAGSSTGEEPYTLSIICQELLDPSFKFKIDALDIDSKALETAQKGVYSERSIKEVPLRYLEKYFAKTGNVYQVRDLVKKYVHFHRVNLFDRDALLSVGKNYDFVFCRNVLIYFSNESRRKVVESFYAMMNLGGYIFLGHSESLSRITTAFELKRMGGYLVYQKPLSAGR
mgnify:CR=1 FL=1